MRITVALYSITLIVLFSPAVFSATCTRGQSCQPSWIYNGCTDCKAGEYQPESVYNYEGYEDSCSYPSTCRKCPSGKWSLPKSSWCYDTEYSPAFRFPTGALMDQGGCGSCYTFAANQVFADRTNYHLGRSSNPIVFSPQAMVSCNRGGCDGGTALNMFEWIKGKGAKTCRPGYGYTKEAGDGCSAGCAPYTSGFLSDGEQCKPKEGEGDCWGETPKCSSMSSCPVTFPENEYNPACLPRNSNGYVPAEMIQMFLRNEGTVAVSLQAGHDKFQQFWYNDKKAIYTEWDWSQDDHVRNDHAVVIVGWNTANGIDYWIVKNSWGSSWGDGGFFYVERGKNVLGIERDICVMPPARNVGRRLSKQNKTFTFDGKTLPSKTGHWFEHDVTSKDVTKVVDHFAGRHNAKILRVMSAQKQVVNGNNHRIVFDAVGSDGKVNTHSVSAYVTTQGEIYRKKEHIEPKGLSTLVIVGAAGGAVVVLAGMVAVVYFKRRKQKYVDEKNETKVEKKDQAKVEKKDQAKVERNVNSWRNISI